MMITRLFDKKYFRFSGIKNFGPHFKGLKYFQISFFSGFVFFLLFALSSCKIKYSFTGASIAPDVKTVSVKYFPSFAPLAKPTFSQLFTEGLRDIFLKQTQLNLVDNYGDLQFEGEITDYSVQPVAIQGNQTAALTRLTVGVNIRFVNTKNTTQNFETKFSRFADFDQSKGLSSVEDQLLREINSQLVQDIFNRSVSNW